MATSFQRPQTKYARSGDVHIAYQVFGEGELDLVAVPGFASHVELVWDHEPSARWLEGLASFARVITYDKRGTGLSDPVPDAPSLEVRMDDVRAVMDAAGSERAALLGISEGVAMAILFAAAFPDRTQALISLGGTARSTQADDYPYGTPSEALIESGAELVLPHWGEGATVDIIAPSVADDPDVRAAFGRRERGTVTPGMLGQLVAMYLDIDVRHVVPSVHVPALVLHRRYDRLVNVRNGRWLAENLPNAKLVELPGNDHIFWYEEPKRSLDEIKEFLTGTRFEVEAERVLSTVLFTDIVDSTKRASEMGDAGWRELLQRHAVQVEEHVERYKGRMVKSIGDGFLATFDGPARAIRAAQAIEEAASSELGLGVRAGLHTGECEVIGDDIGGIAVHIAARVSSLADAGEVLVSRTVRDLVAGSGVQFEDRGEHELKGVPESWQLLAVA